MRTALLLALITACTVSAEPLDPGYLAAHYTKYEALIPMRDGKRLFTNYYVPKDRTHAHPILLTRTPYSIGPYGEDNYGKFSPGYDEYLKEGYILAAQDVRGRFQSEGVFLEMTPQKDLKRSPQDVDESSDAYDTIDWLVKHVPGNNGRVGLVGISYPGFYAAAGMIDAHPALKAVSPQAPVTDLFNGDDSYHFGALFLAANFGFYTSFHERKGDPAPPGDEPKFDFKTQDGYQFYLGMGPLYNSNELYLKNSNPYWTDVMKHTRYDDFWKARNLVPHIRDIKPAVLVVGGWFDAEDLSGPLKVFRAVQKTSPGTPDTLVMGPWRHGGWARGDGDHLGDVQFGSKTSLFFQEKIQFPFFQFHLQGKGDGKFPKAWLFETGTNEWKTFEQWPPREAAPKVLRFAANGKLLLDQSESEEGFDEYVSDPSKPVPFIGYTALDMDAAYMTADQRFAATRTDVLVYQTEPLKEDLTIAGPVSPHMIVSSSGTDSDWVVKLIDVYPNTYPDSDPKGNVRMGGYQQLVRGEPFRGKFRNSMENPEPLTPNQPARLEFDMPDSCHTFRRGHRIMVQIQSSWFPLIDRNPQKFMEIPDARAADFQKAVQRVYRGGKNGSSIRILVLPPASVAPIKDTILTSSE